MPSSTHIISKSTHITMPEPPATADCGKQNSRHETQTPRTIALWLQGCSANLGDESMFSSLPGWPAHAPLRTRTLHSGQGRNTEKQAAHKSLSTLVNHTQVHPVHPYQNNLHGLKQDVGYQCLLPQATVNDREQIMNTNGSHALMGADS